MNSMLNKVRESVSAITLRLVVWAIFAAVVLALVACVYFFGFWTTFVGTLLIFMLFMLSHALSDLAEIKREIKLTQDLVKGPPQLKEISARRLQVGMYIHGSDKIDFLFVDEKTGRIDVGVEGSDGPMHFDPDEIVEVTNRSLLPHDGGYETASSSRWTRISAVMKDAVVYESDADA